VVDAATETEGLDTSFRAELRKVMAESQDQAGEPAATEQPEAPADELAELADAVSEDSDEQTSDGADESGAQDSTADSDPETQTLAAPESWSVADREAFDGLAAEGQEVLLGIHKNIRAGLTKAQTEAANLRKQYAPLERYFDNLATQHKKGREDVAPTVIRNVPQVMDTYIRLLSNPVEGMAELSEQLGVTSALSDHLSSLDFDEGTSQLRNENARLKRQLQERQYQETDAAAEQATDAISSFEIETDDAGQPKHPHFEAVRPYMAKLMEVDSELDIEAAYAAAVRAKFPDELKPDTEAIRKQVIEEIKTKARKVRKSAPSSDGRSGPGTSIAKDDEASETRRETIAKLFKQQLAS